MIIRFDYCKQTFIFNFWFDRNKTKWIRYFLHPQTIFLSSLIWITLFDADLFKLVNLYKWNTKEVFNFKKQTGYIGKEVNLMTIKQKSTIIEIKCSVIKNFSWIVQVHIAVATLSIVHDIVRDGFLNLACLRQIFLVQSFCRRWGALWTRLICQQFSSATKYCYLVFIYIYIYIWVATVMYDDKNDLIYWLARVFTWVLFFFFGWCCFISFMYGRDW